MADTGIFGWLGRATICGVPEIEHAAKVMQDYYQGVGPEPEYDEARRSTEGVRAAIAADRARQGASPAAAVPEGALPPLPEPEEIDGIHGVLRVYLHADVANIQYEAYKAGRAAVEADRAQHPPTLKLKRLNLDTPEFLALSSALNETQRKALVGYVQAIAHGYARDAIAADRAQQGEPVAWLRAVEPDEIPDWPWPFAFVDASANEAILDVLDAFPVYRAATKAAAPADARIEALARKLVEFYPTKLPEMYCDGQPVGRQLAEACRAPADAPKCGGTGCRNHACLSCGGSGDATPTLDTGIPTAGEAWIDLKDAKPRDWQPVLVALDSGEVVCGVRGSGGWHWDETDRPEDAEATATHWMPWPSHPSGAQTCTCPSGDGSLRWPCPVHPSEAKAGESK